MRKLKYFILLIIVVSLSALCACNGGNKDTKALEESRAAYSIVIEVSEGLEKAHLTEEVTFTNATGDSLNELAFYIYPEAYREGASRSAYFESMRFNGVRYGGIDIVYVEVEGEKVDFNCEDIWLTVPLPEPLEDGSSISMKTEADIYIPSGTLRLGGDKHLARLLNFYPILQTYSDGAWAKCAYSRIGDPFYSGSASYNISVIAPKSVSVATSGRLIEDIVHGDRHTVKAELKEGRDMAVVLADGYTKDSREARGVTFNYYSLSGEGYLDYLIEAAETFMDFFGAFPYEEMSVCESPFYYGGMEYPGLVVINEGLPDKDKKEVIVHELLHQWIGCAVGSDGVGEPWVDESLVTYLTAYYYKLTGDNEAYSASRSAMLKQFDAFYKTAKLNAPGYVPRINRNIYEFDTLYEYDAVVYKRGAEMYFSLNDIFGDKKLSSALKDYYLRYAHSNATGEELIYSLERSLGNKVGSIMRSYLEADVKSGMIVEISTSV